MSKVSNQWIDLFRAGDYSGDDKGVFTTSDLDQIVENYDPAHYEAFSSIGHVKDDKAPAYGWWAKLRRVGDLLQGKMGTVQPEFEEALEKELYKKRSVGLVKRAKGWTLHHVAWLGAQAPHIKALADLKFEGEDENAIEIDFSEQGDNMAEQNEQVVTGVVDKLKEALGLNTKHAEKTFSEADVTKIATEAAKAAAEAAVKPLQEEIAAHKTAFSEREKSLTTAETKSRAAAALQRVKDKGAYVPAFDVQGVPALFDELAKATETVEFGEGDKKTSKSPVDVLADFMISFGEIVPKGREVKDPTHAASKVVHTNASAASVQFDEAIKAYAKEHKVTYSVAMDHVAKEHPELASSKGQSTAGQV